jgi:hypothetical protein
MAQSHPLMGRGFFYAQGWFVSYDVPHSFVWHNGGATGTNSVVAFVPDAGLGVVVLCNLETMVPEILAQWVLDRYLGKEGRRYDRRLLIHRHHAADENAPAESSPALPWSAYTGRYHNPVYGEVAVSRREGGLVVTIGPRRTRLLLSHLSRDTFQWGIEDWDWEPDLLAHFSVDASGRANELIMDPINSRGAGAFRRVKSDTGATGGSRD